MADSKKDNAPEPVAPEPVAPEPVVEKQVSPEPVAPEPVVEKQVSPEPVAPEPEKKIDDHPNIKVEVSYKDFNKIIRDFTNDLLKTYPELDQTLDSNLRIIYEDTDKEYMSATKEVYEYCIKKYPEKFFDILYQNEDIFNDDKNADFLPNIDFKVLWKENISDNTRASIWKYLQLILFTIVSSLKSDESFGDTAKLFEAINKDEFMSKLEETMGNMSKLFDSTEEGENNSENNPMPDKMPTPEDIHEHVSGMMNGKLGKLAKEIADETAKDLNIDETDATSVNDVFEKLFKQPTKLMSLVKKVGSKLDTKMKSGDIKESELLEEASLMMNKMQNMPGMGNIKEMLGKMGLNGKMDFGSMKNNLNKNMRAAKQKERMKEKLNERKMRKDAASMQEKYGTVKQNTPTPTERKGSLQTHGVTDGVEKMTFSTGENVEKSAKQSTTGNKKKRKKHKK